MGRVSPGHARSARLGGGSRRCRAQRGAPRAAGGALAAVLSAAAGGRGLLDAGVSKIEDELLVAAAEAIADCVTPSQLNASFIVPSVFDPQVVTKVAAAVKKISRK